MGRLLWPVLSLTAVLAAAAQNESIYPPLYAKYSQQTPVFINASDADTNPLFVTAEGSHSNLTSPNNATALLKPFVYFDPSSFQIMQMNAGDNALYGRFTALKSTYPGLSTWVSIGGWSFNDDNNSPNTQTAFSDMASSAENRQAFISSLQNFMQTYGFDGVDIDWEYPRAPDRGGVNADTENFVTLLSEMRATWGTTYGISATLPSSYWYMRWFDIAGMEQYLDWFNFMSYDIHGVWDSSNKFTGPYILPSTNLTEIKLGLDLLWRNGINPTNVNLGLALYGRSFTLSDPSCSTPNGVCEFSAGGNAGQCTQTAGILSGAEILQVLAQTGAQPTFDTEAAVKWITWDSNQWVSYDDGDTFALKKQAANNLCLGGTMVWAVDMDNGNGDMNSEMTGASSLSTQEKAQLKDRINQSVQQAISLNTCYWTECGDGCQKGYFSQTQARGQINGVNYQEVCKNGQVEQLCCPSGSTMGDCVWEGWNGVGIACNSSDSCHQGQTAIAFNTNNYYSQPRESVVVDQTCNGGYQTYCCNGFKPNPKKSASSLNLIGANGKDTHPGMNKVKLFFETLGCAIAGGFAFFLGELASGGDFIAGGIATGAVFTPCEIKAARAAMYKAVGVIAGVSNSGNGGQVNPAPRPAPANPVTGALPNAAGQPKMYGQWTSAVYDPNVDQDCAVTYTCRYGLGWDEICDNQRWGIYSANAGRSVYHYAERLPDPGYAKASWARTRKSWYRNMAQASVNNVARCQVDEFPMGSLWEGRNEALIGSQVCRLVNGPANGAQGRDWAAFLLASWWPCSALRDAQGLPPPPVTWAFDLGQNNPRQAANQLQPHFVGAYGFDSQTAGSLCWASYTVARNDPITTVLDHGFRALPNDPMFRSNAIGWPSEPYTNNPGGRNAVLPQNVASAAWQKRENVRAVLEGVLPVDFANSDIDPHLVDCNSCDYVVDEANDLIYDRRPQPEIPVTVSEAVYAPTNTAHRADTGATISAATIPKQTQMTWSA
ncbi:hypothetical protein DV736_g6556, partial [Chaetothyriales sp. CBS 134916]